MEIRELGYILVGAPAVDEWRSFATGVVGAMAMDADDGVLYIKTDPRAFRVAVIPGRANGLIASGWLVAGPQAFAAARAALAADGVAIEDGEASGARLRCVQAFFAFRDPAGHLHEIAWGPISDHAPFVSPAGVSGFVTEDMGLGHVVLTAVGRAFDDNVAFWTQPGRFTLSDILHLPAPAGIAPPRIHFMHCANPRQHSLALGDLPVPGGCIHIMFEAKTLDDVGRCLDRATRNGVKIVATLGRHVNDEMVSFYMVTPGGFALEYGCGGKQVDWREHVAFETTRGSDWGHVWSPTG
jgi:3,4-dihydroxy-9,10-secoandrosta-1,3,5(10)-triene-9,17-dione 4,5-dioxygenase